MPTIIDSLIVQLGLDPKGFKAGSDEAQKQSKKTTDAVKKDAAASAAATDAAEKKRIAAIDKAAKQSATASKKAADSREKDAKRVGEAEKKSADTTVASFRRVATEFIGLFVAVRSVSDVVGFFERINASTRQLGLDSQNFGIAASELRDWQNAAVLAGGTAEGVTKTVQGLEQSLFQLKYNGQFSDQLLYLSRLGVQFQTTAGQIKPFKDILFATAAAIEKRHLARPEAFQYLQAAGFDPGSINLILSGTKALQAYYDQQKKLPQLTDAQVAANTRLAVAWDGIKQKVTAAGETLLVAAEPALTTLFGLINKGVDYLNAHDDAIGKWFQGALTWVTGPGGVQLKNFFTDLASLVRALASALGVLDSAGGNGSIGAVANSVLGIMRNAPNPTGFGIENWIGRNVTFAETPQDAELNRRMLQPRAGEDYSSVPYLRAAEQKYGLPTNLLLRIADQESGFRKDVISGRKRSPSGAVGLMQLLPQYFMNAGKTGPIQDIDIAAKYLVELHKQFGDWALAVAAYNDGPGNVKKMLAGQKSLPLETSNYLNRVIGPQSNAGGLYSGGGYSIFEPNPGALAAARAAQPTPSVSPFAGPPTSSTGGPSTNLQIDTMNVNTQATDANGIAGSIKDSIRRKFTLAQVEPGLA